MAEAVKHGAIADAAYFAFLEREAAAVTARDPAALERVVRRSVEIKAEVVAADEREAGRRAILNFGHTVGRSEEHTSELQSRLHLVCRLLLEKKKTYHELALNRQNDKQCDGRVRYSSLSEQPLNH